MDRDTDQHTDGYGTWTEEFSQLHHAATTGASTEEIRRLEAAELEELAS